MPGSPGGWGVCLAAAQVGGGAGGHSTFGGGGKGVKNITANGAAAINSYGGGGAGATIVSGGATKTGGAGANGLIRVWEFVLDG